MGGAITRVAGGLKKVQFACDDPDRGTMATQSAAIGAFLVRYARWAVTIVVAVPSLQGCDGGWKNGTYIMHEYVEETCGQKDEFYPGVWDSKALCASQHPNAGGIRYIACFTEQPDRSKGKDYRESDTPAFGFGYRDSDGSWIGQGVVQGHSDDGKSTVCSTKRILMGPIVGPNL